MPDSGKKKTASAADTPTYIPRAPSRHAPAAAATPPPEGYGASPAPAFTFGDHVTPDFGARYEVLDVLGEGGMGTVYKAYDRELDRVVALKLIRRELTADPGASQRFKQELLLASKIWPHSFSIELPVQRVYTIGLGEGWRRTFTKKRSWGKPTTAG